MANQKKSPFFSIVIPTRDRPELFKLALDSVLIQDFKDFEIHIVNDGSSGEYLDLYKELEKDYPKNVNFHYLTYRPNGHGQSYSMNYGAYFSEGEYLCFLDDDDYWIDEKHLSRAASSIKESNNVIDLYYTNQKAYFSDGRLNEDPVWIEDLTSILTNVGKDESGSYLIDVETILKSNGFAHLNCSIFLRELYDNINGMDEHIRYECDRDIYIRALDASENILYNPAFVSKHHIPDPKKTSNMSTMISIYEKKLFQLRVFEKSILFSKKPELIAYSMWAMGIMLKQIAEALETEKKYDLAYFYAKKALGALPTFKWLSFTLLLFIKSKFI